MKTWNQAKDFIHDASGIKDPENWIWKAENGIYYPVAQLETYRFNGQVNVMYTIDNVLYEGKVAVKTGEHGGETYEFIDYIEWDCEELNEEDQEKVIGFLETNFVEYIIEAETL